MKTYPLAKPYITQKEIASVSAVLRSGQLSLGPKQKEFEKKFSQKLRVKYACAVSSGTAGLHLAMLACEIKEGDEVITSPFSFVASANCILYVVAKPVFCDIDPITYNLDPAKIEAKITPKTKAILVVHILGQPCDMAPILKIAKKHKLLIIEDACESILSTYHKKMAGTFGKAGVFAFYPNKQMTTGEGGMIVTNNKKIYELCESLKNQGRDINNQWLNHIRLGYNYRLNEMSCSLGITQLAKIDWLIKERQKIACLYEKYLGKYPKLLQTPQIAKDNTHTWFVYVVLAKNQITRDRTIQSLEKTRIASKPYFPAIHLLDFYQKMGYKKGDFSICENISSRALALPFYLGLAEKDIQYISQTLIKILAYGNRK